jgi:transcriptional regulator with XRE-family HTH domain
MNPTELRSFRESIGASRKEFARLLFISEPTLERWERGKGGPREIHLNILRGMRERLGSANREPYFQYDPKAADSSAELLGDERRLVLETLRGMAAVLLAERRSEDGTEWDLRFGLGWAAGDSLEVSLACEGSLRPERPAVDFVLEVSGAIQNPTEDGKPVGDICFNHGLSCHCATAQDGRTSLLLRQRLFRSGCNAETIRHIVRNYHSCWLRLRAELHRQEEVAARTKS